MTCTWFQSRTRPSFQELLMLLQQYLSFLGNKKHVGKQENLLQARLHTQAGTPYGSHEELVRHFFHRAHKLCCTTLSSDILITLHNVAGPAASPVKNHVPICIHGSR
eukprot:1155152-Pelagomonas_calceolata.AAC.4